MPMMKCYLLAISENLVGWAFRPNLHELLEPGVRSCGMGKNSVILSEWGVNQL